MSKTRETMLTIALSSNRISKIRSILCTDAEKALVIAPHSTKARIAKAEALYSMGQFEKVPHSVWEGIVGSVVICHSLVPVPGAGGV